MVRLWFDLARDDLFSGQLPETTCVEFRVMYLVWSSGAVAICLNVPFKGIVGCETMYAAMPTWTPVETTSSAAHKPAATSAMVIDDGNVWLYERYTDPGMNILK
jgi:hypothetical protein